MTLSCPSSCLSNVCFSTSMSFFSSVDLLWRRMDLQPSSSFCRFTTVFLSSSWSLSCTNTHKKETQCSSIKGIIFCHFCLLNPGGPDRCLDLQKFLTSLNCPKQNGICHIYPQEMCEDLFFLSGQLCFSLGSLLQIQRSLLLWAQCFSSTALLLFRHCSSCNRYRASE